MNAKQINLALWSGAAAIAVAAIGGLLCALVWPLEHQLSLDATGGSSKIKSTTGPAIPELAAFEKIWKTPLRQPLGEAIPVAPVVPVAVAPATAVNPVMAMTANVPVSLVGTIGTSLAMLKTMSNAVEVCAVGESLSGVTVVAVRTAEVDVRFNGQLIKLSKPAELQLH